MKNKRGWMFICAGLMMIASAAGLTGYNIYDAYRAEVGARNAMAELSLLIASGTERDAASANALQRVQISAEEEENTLLLQGDVLLREMSKFAEGEKALPEHEADKDYVQQSGAAAATNVPVPTPEADLMFSGAQAIPTEVEFADYILNPEMEMPVVSNKGQDYIGVLTIPDLGLELPVISEWSYPRLRIAPCRYTGSVYTDNMVISAHNYGAHFGNIKKLKLGSRIIFTDVDGNRFVYEVVLKETLEPDAVWDMTHNEFDLSLFTCTVGGAQRVTVRCDRVLIP